MVRNFIVSLICLGFLFIYLPNHGKGYVRETDWNYNQTMILYPDRAFYYDSLTGYVDNMDIDQALRWMWHWEQKWPRISTIIPDIRPKGE